MAISKEFIAHVKSPPRNLITLLLYSAGIFFILKSFTSIELTSLWNDELSTAEKSFQDSIDYLYNYLARDTHPPFYYLVMMVAGQVFGKTFLTLRGLSWFSYFGSCFIANLVIREQKLRQPYPAAMFLLTASTPFAFRYSSEGKAYSMIMLIIMLFLLFRTKLENTSEKDKSFVHIFYTITLAAASLTHFYGYAFALCASTCDLAFKRYRFTKANCLALILPTAWTISHANFLITQKGRKTLNPTSIDTLKSIVKTFLGSNWEAIFIAIAFVLILCLVVLNAKYSKKILCDYSIDACFLLITITLLISVFKPSSHARYYIIALPSFLCGVVSLAAMAMETKKIHLLIKMLIPGLFLATIFDFWHHATTPFRNPQILTTRNKTEHRTASLLGVNYDIKLSRQSNSLQIYDKILTASQTIPKPLPSEEWRKISSKNNDKTLKTHYQNIPEGADFLYALSRNTYIRRNFKEDLLTLKSLGAKCERLLPTISNLRALHCHKPKSD